MARDAVHAVLLLPLESRGGVVQRRVPEIADATGRGLALLPRHGSTTTRRVSIARIDDVRRRTGGSLLAVRRLDRCPHPALRTDATAGDSVGSSTRRTPLTARDAFPALRGQLRPATQTLLDAFLVGG